MKLKTVIRFFTLCIITNILVACTGPDGVTQVSFAEWLFQTGPAYEGHDGTAPFTTFFTSVGAILTGPYGIAAGIIGTGVPAFMKAKKTGDGIGGVVTGVQAGRAALTKEQRLAFDNASRSAMSDLVKGDPRGLVRKVKVKLKKANKISSERLSDKHVLIDEAKKAMAKLLE